jgi:hypothetical protein
MPENRQENMRLNPVLVTRHGNKVSGSFDVIIPGRCLLRCYTVDRSPK